MPATQSNSASTGLANRLLTDEKGTYYIVRNSVTCLQCKDNIESKYTHDFVTCSCGATSVDGGHEYFRRVGEPHLMKDTSLVKYVNGTLDFRNKCYNEFMDLFLSYWSKDTNYRLKNDLHMSELVLRRLRQRNAKSLSLATFGKLARKFKIPKDVQVKLIQLYVDSRP